MITNALFLILNYSCQYAPVTVANTENEIGCKIRVSDPKSISNHSIASLLQNHALLAASLTRAILNLKCLQTEKGRSPKAAFLISK